MLQDWIRRFLKILGRTMSRHNSTQNSTNRCASRKRVSASTSRGPKTAGHRAVVQPFRAVTIYSRQTCCAAASRIENKRFLAQHAPQLPLGSCTQASQCQCRYQYLVDRRQEMRRDADHGLPDRPYNRDNQRNRRDRRTHAHQR